MYRLIAVICLHLLLVSGLDAQEPLDFNTFNTETYRLYLEQEWDSLIDMGKVGLERDMDFYYLRMRMGIAYYSGKNYRKAAGHFEEALRFNQDDPVALEYLYYSRLLSGEAERADHVKQRFRGDLALKLPPGKGRFFDGITAEYLYSTGVDDDLFNNIGDFFVTVPGVQYITRHFSNASLSLVNALAPGIRLTHSYTYLAKSNHYLLNDGISYFHSSDQHVFQHQYYLSPQFHTASGSVFSPMVHILRIGHQALLTDGQGYMGGASQWPESYLYETDFSTGLGFRQGIGNMDLHLGGWFSLLNGAQQIQNRLGFSWFPLGNLNLYTGGHINTQYEAVSGREGTLRLIPEWLFGFTISEKIWFDMKASIGDMTNYLETNGMIIYNSYSEIIDKVVKCSIAIPVSDKGSLFYLGGRWSSNRSEYAIKDSATDIILNKITYQSYSIYGGLSWKF